MKRWWWVVFLISLVGCSLPNVVVIRDPLTPEEHFQLGLAYEQNRDFDLALREYDLAAETLPLAHHHLGNVHFQKQDYESAEKAYRKAIDLLPRDPNPRNNLAWMFYTLGKNLEEAESLARQAVDLAPADKKAPYQDTLDHILKAGEKAK